jgi:hypothetical protein
VADPGAHLRLDLPVLAREGHALGRVAGVHHDALTGRLTGLTVRHGFLGHRHTQVPTEDLARVSAGIVVLVHSRTAFDRLPNCDAPRSKTLTSDFTWSR